MEPYPETKDDNDCRLLYSIGIHEVTYYIIMCNIEYVNYACIIYLYTTIYFI